MGCSPSLMGEMAGGARGSLVPALGLCDSELVGGGLSWTVGADWSGTGVEVTLEQFPSRCGRQPWHGLPAFTHEQFLQRPVRLHLQQDISAVGCYNVAMRAVRRPVSYSWLEIGSSWPSNSRSLALDLANG